MCMVFYLGSDHPLPRIPWDRTNPAFHVSDIEDHAGVTRHFSKPFVCYVGSHEGCGCGFQSNPYPEFDDADDLTIARHQRAQLAAYLRAALAESETLELFSCWSGDETKDVAYHDVILPEDLLRKREHFRELELMRVVPSRSD